MQAKYFNLWLKTFSEQALLSNERRLVVLSGNENWALELLSNHIFFLEENVKKVVDTCLIYGDSNAFPTNVSAKRFRDKLGSECQSVIFADSLFRIDALAALSGMIKSGGILFIIMPKLELMKQQSAFFKRFFNLLDNMPPHVLITENKAEIPEKITTKNIDGELTGSDEVLAYSCITAEQLIAVNAIKKVVTGHRKRPLVLTADRGRGKSSALAIACAQFLIKHEFSDFNIIITAPDSQALTVFFRQLRQSLPNAKHGKNNSVLGKATLSFIAVDQLLKQPVKVNLVLVDEAAAIPVYLLEKLLNSYHRMVFSSTVHGYEGAGRGFTLKFQKILDNLCSQWVALHINQPIRWRKNDPLEQLVFDACLLNAELPRLLSSPQAYDDNLVDRTNNLDSFVFKVVTVSELVENEALLRQVFAVLVTAHYQTKPSDLQLLLDNKQVQLACLLSSDDHKAEVLAIALLMNEGAGCGVDDADISAIKDSQRRLRNHFLPQSLLSHCGFEQAFDYHYLRIMRIAVHPHIQQKGLGSYFLAKIKLLAVEQGADFVGSSFGVNPELLSFWLKSGYSTVRIGFTKDKSSGEHSALVMTGCNAIAKETQRQFKKEFYRSFDFLLLEEYKNLRSDLVRLLLIHNEKEDLSALSALDIANVQAFSKSQRLYSSCAYSLYLWFKHDLLLVNKPYINEAEQESLILVSRLLQRHDIDSVCQQYSLTGKKMLNKHIKEYICLRLNSADL